MSSFDASNVGVAVGELVMDCGEIRGDGMAASGGCHYCHCCCRDCSWCRHGGDPLGEVRGLVSWGGLREKVNSG